MQLPFAGGCLCNAVRYRSMGAPLAMYNCHCRGCQRIHGNAFAPLLVMSVPHVQITGTLQPCPVISEEDRHRRRHCCPVCALPLFAGNPAVDDILLINALSLDDPSWYAPVADIWTSEAQPWVCMDYHLPKVYKSSPVIDQDTV